MFILALDTLSDLKPIFQVKPEAIVLGVQDFAARSNANVPLEDLPKWVNRFEEQGIKVFVNMQGMLEQSHIKKAKEALEKVIHSGVQGIYVADDGYITLADELSLKLNKELRSLLIMQPETLICSGEDANFYLSLGLQAASLSHELSLDEILQAIQTAPNVELLVAGHYSWMESRRGLIENYLRFCEQPESFVYGRMYTIQEKMREARLPLWQDEKGTHILSDIPLNVGKDILDLSQAGLKRFRIDAFLKGNDWATLQLQAFRQALNSNLNETNIEELEESTLLHQQTWIKKED